MKNLRWTVVFTIVAFSVLASSVFAANAPYKSANLKENAINSLLTGVESENLGLKTSSALMLANIECPKAVIPLLRMLKSDPNEQARMTAAYALYQLKDQRGLFAIKQAVRFDDSNKVKRLCWMLYKEYLRTK
jgi:HEAT repeat protein